MDAGAVRRSFTDFLPKQGNVRRNSSIDDESSTPGSQRIERPEMRCDEKSRSMERIDAPFLAQVLARRDWNMGG